MRFSEKFPKAAKKDFKELVKDESVGWELKRTGRFFLCDVCRKQLTEFRDTSMGYEMPVCSEECRKAFMERPGDDEAPVQEPAPAATPEPQPNLQSAEA